MTQVLRHPNEVNFVVYCARHPEGCEAQETLQRIADSIPSQDCLVMQAQDLFDCRLHTYIRRGTEEPECYEWVSLCYVLRDPICGLDTEYGTCSECDERLAQLHELKVISDQRDAASDCTGHEVN